MESCASRTPRNADAPGVVALSCCAGTHRRRSKNSPRDEGYSGFVRSSDSDGQVARFVVGLEVYGERVRLVGGVVGAVAFERACRLEVEERGRSVGLALRLDFASTEAGSAIWGVSVSILAANSFASSTVARECAGVSPVRTFTGVSVSW